MRIFRSILLGCMLTLPFTVSTYAQDISVTLNDAPLTCRTAPVLENDRVLVPMRDIFEPLGYDVTWEQKQKTITAVRNDTVLQMKADAVFAAVGNTKIALDAPVRIQNGITMVPLRFVAQHSGANVAWDGKNAVVSITTHVADKYEVADSVVTIMTNKNQGSGVILSKDGKIATNYHVIENASMGQVIFSDGTVYQGDVTVVGLDPKADIAILKIKEDNLTPIGKTADVAIGEKIMTISSPQGKRNTKTEGQLLAKNNDILSFSAPIKQGSSGGGLFNAKGNWIGMCSSFYQNSYYAIPAKKVLAVPTNLQIPIGQMKNYAYRPSVPQNITITKEGDRAASVYWTPVYGVDYYRIYSASALDGPYKKLTNKEIGNDHWFWGFPHSFKIAYSGSRQPLFIKVEAMKNGASLGMSNPVQVF